MKKHIPNLITCLNVTSGALAIYMAFNGNLLIAAWLVILAMVFDFFDGFAARLLHVKSDMGKELDSLADMVSFGVMPAVMAYFLIRETFCSSEPGETYYWVERVLSVVPLLVPAFSAYRLAKFNLDTRQTHSFIGLPTPSNALFWVMLVFCLYYRPEFFMMAWGNAWLLAVCSLVFAILLISEVPMFSLKLTNFSWKENSLLYCFLGMVLIGFAIWNVKALTYMIPVYILISCYNFKKKMNWVFWSILLVILGLLGIKALYMIVPACLIVIIVRLTSRSNQ
ncbi:MULTISPECIES: CDP-diacylglycerol--serine O-phosphatidyltransferase [Butyricimonas]|uniref:CDP-diacylglycerol--serine O-phosphatidyltransferase n=1 Tax=Butyricimonas TaxID=574697 RepID=UPI001D07B854|nr:MULTISPECIES: CDP-diacylglycerol--serine O-phosphatidyltransferase [Butyricimonas]MCB6974001.1 CDP-diacylglycerol--serine O-phosphatidyltransferase [Butyricimonas synergistica]MCG4520937.1 CDP-diacylglycerol--serine O-phosphatidyltransferase [Butyricimonas sp. DFI.6.44]